MNVVRNIMPAIAVMVAGLLGAWLVFDGFYSDNITATKLSHYEPAAGEEMAVDTDTTAEGDEWEFFTEESTATESEAMIEGEADVAVEDAADAAIETSAEAEADVEDAAAEAHDHMHGETMMEGDVEAETAVTEGEDATATDAEAEMEASTEEAEAEAEADAALTEIPAAE